MKPESLKLSLIRLDAGTQSRAGTNEEVVADYAERYQQGDQFPPVVVFNDGSEYFLADGFHRVLACLRNEYKDVLADVRKGTRLDALKYSLGANRANGLRRSNADKHHAVQLALKEFSDLSSNAVSNLCGVSHTFVDSLRSQVATVATSKRKGADGKSYPAKKKPSPEVWTNEELDAAKTEADEICTALGWGESKQVDPSEALASKAKEVFSGLELPESEPNQGVTAAKDLAILMEEWLPKLNLDEAPHLKLQLQVSIKAMDKHLAKLKQQQLAA